MYQVGAAAIGPWICDVFATGRIVGRHGNADPDMAPHGAYRTRGDDRWIAIAVDSDAAWEALRAELGIADRPQWRSTAGRLADREAIDAAVAAAVAGLDAATLEARLQAGGVAAGRVLDCAQLLADPQLAARGFFDVLTHPEATGIGARAYIGRPWRMSGVSLAAKRTAPRFAEHNAELLRELGYDEAQRAQLAADGVAPASPLIGARGCAPLPLDAFRAAHRIRREPEIPAMIGS
jgi:crotonobetainyl-CoA:carnitine CoA-transferase CaiB-like acyl-CoA transferase